MSRTDRLGPVLLCELGLQSLDLPHEDQVLLLFCQVHHFLLVFVDGVDLAGYAPHIHLPIAEGLRCSPMPGRIRQSRF